MAVYQPNAIVGNSHVLASLGARGELMTFHYPNIDFPQNLREGMPAVYLRAEAGAGRLSWTFQDEWRGTQRYLGRTNVVETLLVHTPTGLQLRIVDFVHPAEALLVRRYELVNRGPRPLDALLLQYLDPQLGEVQHRNAVHYHPEHQLAVAYWRNICLVAAPDQLDEYGCGRAGAANSAKRQMEAGRLNRQREEIGDVDLAIGWREGLRPGEQAAHELMLVADSNEPGAVARAERARQMGWEALYRETARAWEAFVARTRPVALEADLTEAYYRCLLGLALLVDGKTGSVVAAPEFDPFFERSGGYGYCWPRDAVEVCLALEMAGYPEYLGRFLSWARRAQREEGYWDQRYWLSGERGPSWCTHEDTRQIDQTASVLFAIGRHARGLREAERLAFLEQLWHSARKAAGFLTEAISPDTGLHRTGFDLWETFRGSFTYTNAAIAAALGEAAFLARQVGEPALAERWAARAEQLRRTVVSKLCVGRCFVRGYDAEGNVDPTPDSSILGLITPFRLLSLADPEQRTWARELLDDLVARIGVMVKGGEALRRFAGDTYAGGGPSAVSTLWLARARLELALEGEDRGPQRERAIASMRAVLTSATSTGLLPEMMGPAPGSYWAVPHGWAMACFVMAARLLDRLDRGTSSRAADDGERREADHG